MKLGKLMILGIAVLAAVYIGVKIVPAGSNVVLDSHEGHDHGEGGYADHTGHDEQADYDDYEGYADHDEASAMQFSPADMDRLGIEVGRAGAGEFEVHVNIPGEITVNSDRMAHIIPTVSGIVCQVSKKLGDTVKAGETIAWLESPELGNSKIDYLGKLAEVNCCSMDLTRAEEIHDNTVNLLAVLKESPSLETLQETNGIAMGDNRSKLISAYAEYTFAKAAYLREKPLFEQKITSEQDFLKAENAFKKADAEYTAVCDSIAFDVQRNLMEAQREDQLRRMELKGAERQLKILGLASEDIEAVELLAQNPDLAGPAADDCPDPNCEACKKKRSAGEQLAVECALAEEKLAWYPLIAPFDGTIIEKHITLGEKVGDDLGVFVVADLSTVWVDLRVNQKDLPLIKKGQKAVIEAKSGLPAASGTIGYVEPVINEQTRTALARMVLDNSSGLFRPGTFVTADVLVEKRRAKVTVARSILQDVDNVTCVFILDEHGFEPRPVTVGESNGEYVEIVAGLMPGEQVVTKNSFRLKAELEKGAGGAHAGHSH